MGYVAVKPLRWGDRVIEPGEPVPNEEGRNYASLLRSGRIAKVVDLGDLSDGQLVEHAKDLKAKLDTAQKRIAELEEGAVATVEVPEEVSPGITPGWPFDAVTGTPLALTDQQRSELVEKEILPAGTEEQPVLAIVTHDGELVVISAPEVASEPESREGEPATEETEEAKPKAKATSKGATSKSAKEPKAKATSKGK